VLGLRAPDRRCSGPDCDRMFFARQAWQRYCCNACSQRAKRRRRAKRRLAERMDYLRLLVERRGCDERDTEALV
jgi:hypothetical protein